MRHLTALFHDRPGRKIKLLGIENIMRMIQANELKAKLNGSEELALIDVREDVEFPSRHLLFAVNIPLSRMEQLIDDLIPRRTTPIILCDAGDGLAEKAAKRLEWLSYSDVSVLAGGNESWAKAGGQLFDGVNVPSKGFGEFIEHDCNTPRITAEELKVRMDRGDDMVILDSRPWDEFRIMSLPGGWIAPAPNCPIGRGRRRPTPKRWWSSIARAEHAASLAHSR